MSLNVGSHIKFMSGDYAESLLRRGEEPVAKIIQIDSDTKITVRVNSNQILLELKFSKVDPPGGAVHFNIEKIIACIENPETGLIVERVNMDIEHPGNFEIFSKGGGRYLKRKSKRRKSKLRKSKKKKKSKTRRRR